MKKDAALYMNRALELAKKGGRMVAPNPMVGAVIVKNDQIIGEGYHEVFGGPHAEVNAIASVQNPEDLIGATMYVTLEPCRHHGKTPPCHGLINQSGVKKVVIGNCDPFQKSNEIYDSRFMIQDLEGQVADQCKQLNKFFFTWVTKKRPFITVKIAMSADGFVAKEDGQPVHFTTAKEDQQIHQLRADHQAILVGINTILNDDPQLNVRHVQGIDPLRIILDSSLKIPLNARALADQNVLIATSSLLGKTDCPLDIQNKAKRLQVNGFKIWQSNSQNQVGLNELFVYLAKQNISSVLVEPGPTLYQSLKKYDLIDEWIVFKGKDTLGKGLTIDL